MRTRTTVRRGALSATAALGATVLALGLAAPASATVEDDGTVSVDLLGITDFHGGLDRAPSIAAQVNAFRAANDDTLFVSAGDNIGAAAFESGIQDDRPTLAVLEQMQLDASAVGNHEFDRGYDTLVDEVLPQVTFPYLGANVEGAPELQVDGQPYFIAETENDVRVAFIGTVTLETPDVVSPEGIQGLDFTDPVDRTNEIAADLREDDLADVVVALVHEDADVIAPDLGEDVDAVFAGHSHRPVLGTTGAGAPIVQADSSGVLLGHIQLNVDLVTDEITTVERRTLEVDAYDPADLTPDPASFDPAVAETVREAYRVGAELGAREVGVVDAPIRGGSRNGAPSGLVAPPHRGTESPLGNFVAQASFEEAVALDRDPSFGVVNAGGLRSDLITAEDGTVTVRDVFNVLRFGNFTSTIDLTGAQVHTMLEQQFGRSDANRPVLTLGLSDNVDYVYDPAAPVGSKVTQLRIDGVLIPSDSDEVFRVAGNDFLLRGGDQYDVFRDGQNLQISPEVDRASIETLLSTEPVPYSPSYTQRSVGFTADLADEYAPGDVIEAELSSLAFVLDDDPKPEDVIASIDGEQLATAPIDTTPLVQPDRNETGQASILVTLPDDLETGTTVIEFAWTTAGQAQSIEIPIVVAADAEVPPTEDPEETTPPTAAPPTTPPADGDDDLVGDADGGADAGDGAGSGSLPQTGGELGWLAGGVALLTILAGLAMLARRRMA